MGNTVIIDELKHELLTAEHLLNTQYSFEKAEPNYLRCLKIISDAPEMRQQFSELLTGLFDANEISDEPLAFLMHDLRWQEVKEWAENRLRQLANPMLTGRPLEKVLEGFNDKWENQEFYKHFTEK